MHHKSGWKGFNILCIYSITLRHNIMLYATYFCNKLLYHYIRSVLSWLLHTGLFILSLLEFLLAQTVIIRITHHSLCHKLFLQMSLYNHDHGTFMKDSGLKVVVLVVKYSTFWTYFPPSVASLALNMGYICTSKSHSRKDHWDSVKSWLHTNILTLSVYYYTTLSNNKPAGILRTLHWINTRAKSVAWLTFYLSRPLKAKPSSAVRFTRHMLPKLEWLKFQI